jgi:transcriptional regulator with XRE-family HTH domain
MSLQEGRLIRDTRKKLGINQVDLAQQIGLSHQPINQVENGFESISLSNLRKICDVIGLEVIIRKKNV